MYVCILSYPACKARTPHCHLWPVYLIFPHCLKAARYWSYWIQNVCFDILYSCRPKHSQFYDEFSEIWSKTYIGVHVQYRCYCHIVMTLGFIDRFSKNNNKTLHFMNIRREGAELFCGTDRQTDMAKLIAALRNFANALENAIFTKNIVLYNSYGFTGNRRQTTRWPNSLVLQYQATIPRTCIHRYACSTCTFN